MAMVAGLETQELDGNTYRLGRRWSMGELRRILLDAFGEAQDWWTRDAG